MDFLAQNGYDVWAVDIHGYGHAEKTANDWIDSHSAAADIAAAVEYITKLRRVTKINLLGGSAGTQRIGVFTMDHPDKVAKLILYAGFGRGDFAAKEEDLLPFYSQLNTHDKRYLLVPDGGHMLILEKCHRRFQYEVLCFFNRP